MHQQGRLAEAERLYAEILRARPDHIDALQMMALVKLAKGEPAEALQLVTAAMGGRKPSPQILLNYGLILNALGRHAEAIESFEAALKQKSKFADAHNNRGAALSSLGRDEEALEAFRKALAIKPDYAEAHYNNGSSLRVLGRYEEALKCFERALALRPNYFKAHNNRGAVLEAMTRNEAALEAYERALAINPKFSEARVNRTRVLCLLERFDEALAGIAQAIALDPNDAESYYHRGRIYIDLNRNDDALADFKKALAIRPDFAEARFASLFAELPILYADEAEIGRRRMAYERSLDTLCEDVAAGRVGGDLTKALAVKQPFLLAYQGQNDRALQARYGALVQQIVNARYGAPPDLAPPPKPGEPIRLGIVSSFFYLHSNWKIPIKGWLSQIDRTRFKLYGYHVGARRDAETDIAAGLCDRFVHKTQDVAAWRREILADKPHVLIYPGLWMDTVTFQLAAQRLARVQCNSWGHPETSGMDTLDCFFSSDLMEPRGRRRALHRRLGAAAELVDLLRAGGDSAGRDEARRAAFARRRHRVLVRPIAVQIPAAVRLRVRAHRQRSRQLPVRLRAPYRRPAGQRLVPATARCRLCRTRSQGRGSLRFPGAAQSGSIHLGHRPMRRVPRQHRLVGLQFGAGKPAAQSPDRDRARRADARTPQRRHSGDDGHDRHDRGYARRLRFDRGAAGERRPSARCDQPPHRGEQAQALPRPRLRHGASGLP